MYSFNLDLNIFKQERKEKKDIGLLELNAALQIQNLFPTGKGPRPNKQVLTQSGWNPGFLILIFPAEVFPLWCVASENIK